MPNYKISERRRGEPLSETEIKTIRSLAENSLRPQRVADKLCYARSSIMYHIEMIRMKTNLDPTDFYGMTKLLKLIGEDGSDD
jgi:DNA-binding CsgD family transcriptional regulator